MGDTTPMEAATKKRFPRPGKRLAIVLAVLAGLAVLGLGSISYATYDYSKGYEGRILPGAQIAGVDVSGMTKHEAIAAVREAMSGEMEEKVTLTYEDQVWKGTRADLGARLDVKDAVRAALAASDQTSFIKKARMRVLGEELDFSRDVALRYPMGGIRGFVAGIASDFAVEARDASIDYSSGWVEFTKARRGREVEIQKSSRMLGEALRSGSDAAEISVETIEPKVTGEQYKQVLLVHIGDNMLYLYEKGKITHEWPVATGMSDFMTPTGEFVVELKRYMPTWVNPHPDSGWGLSMPESIPPGPNNPLGLRALNWSAPNIRFHGTPSTYSIGYNASHGCVRMYNEDAIELYDLVETGTPIISVLHGDLRPLGSSSSTAAPTAENSAD